MSKEHEEWVGKYVELRTIPGQVHARGRVVSYSDKPTFTVETANGQRVHWLAELTRLIEPPHDHVFKGFVEDGTIRCECGATLEIGPLVTPGRYPVEVRLFDTA